MNMHRKKKMLWGGILIVSASMVSLTACDAGKEDDDKVSIKTTSEVDDNRPASDRNGKRQLLPFSIGFDLKGNPVLLDENGRPDDDWEKVKFPIKTQEIYTIKNSTYAVIKGSCKVVVEIAEDVWVEKTYPTPLCKKWGYL